MLGKLIKPKWQHKKPEVRIQALSQLSDQNPDEKRILELLIRGDADSSVRMAVCKHTLDLALLDEVIKQDTAEEVRQAASNQIKAILAGQTDPAMDSENQLRILRLTTNPDVLYYVASHNSNPDCCQAAIENLDEESFLAKLALESSIPAIREKAANKVSNPDLLKHLLEQSTEKKVLRCVREALKKIQQDNKQREQVRQKIPDLLAHLEAHSKRALDSLYNARLEYLEQSWQECQQQASPDQQQQAARYIEQCQQRIHKEQSRIEQAQAQADAQHELQACILSLHETLGAIDSESWKQMGQLRSAVSMQQRRWQTAKETVAPTYPHLADLQKQYSELIQQWENWEVAVTDFQDRQAELDALYHELLQYKENNSGIPENRLDVISASIQWNTQLAMPTPLLELVEMAGQKAGPDKSSLHNKDQNADEDKKNKKQLHKLLNQFKAELRKKNLRASNRLHNRIQQQLEKTSPALRANFAKQLVKMAPQLDELRDWHAFAAAPKKQELCNRMEQLAEQAQASGNSNLDPVTQAEKIHLLHEEWKSLMSSDQDQDQALWDRFKVASDQAYIPCRDYYREQDAQRAANLEKRKQLCQQLELFLSQQDWDNIQWPAVWEIRQQASKDWRNHSPVHFTDSRETRKTYFSLLAQLDEKLDQASRQHQARLLTLIQKMQSLAEQEAAQEITQQAIQLQQDWKQADWVLPNEYRKLHKTFRKAADQVFNKRNQQRNQLKEQYQQQEKELQQALTTFENLLNQPPGTLLENGLSSLQKQADQLENMPCPPANKKLSQRRNALQKQFSHIQQQLPQWKQWRSLQQRADQLATTDTNNQDSESNPDNEKVIRQALVSMEVVAERESPEEDKPIRMEYQLEILSRAMKNQQNGNKLDQLSEHMATIEQAGALPASLKTRCLTILQELEPDL